MKYAKWKMKGWVTVGGGVVIVDHRGENKNVAGETVVVVSICVS